ncbi:FUSC family protein [Luteolibacter pohnpeiensis]|uniref:FUSC family protein n=1 Tax=Luteolibacter pohnpeiensis TaxID=454153 RepID=A0A934VWG8_9BACT|nr:FUSC family protein [Luteolibacter pohnpeiensis]MBK1882803.1 FUSC family protein [Luteolibacter pohnpeiensis]
MTAAVSNFCIALKSLPQRADAWREKWQGLEFGIQGMLATSLAFYAAILLDLKTPYSAALTVWVVANTQPGQVLAKSFYRIVGTLVGASFAIFLVATMDNMPVLMFTSLALWVGVCTGLGNLFRHFRTYAGLLSGYTAAFVLIGAQTQPDQVMNVALDRTASIVIGVLSMSLVCSLIGKRRSGKQMEEQLKRVQIHLLQALTIRHQTPIDIIRDRRLMLSREYIEAEEKLEFADIENPGFRHRIHRRRAMTGLLFDLLDAGRHQQGVHPYLLEIQQALEPAYQDASHTILNQTRHRLSQILSRMRTAPEAIELQPIIQSLTPWIEKLQPAVLDQASLKDPFDPDTRGAVRHMIRTTCSVLLAAGFWGLTGWQNGSSFLMQSAAICALASTMNRPAKAVLMMTASVAIAAVAGFFCEFYLLPLADNLFSMWLFIALVMIPLSCPFASRNPWLSVIGGTSGLFTLVTMQPANHMSYDPQHFMNFAAAAVFGTLFNVPIFAIILPTREPREVRKTLHRLTRRLPGVRHPKHQLKRHPWRITAHRLLNQLQQNPASTPEDQSRGLALYDLGSGLLYLQEADADLVAFPDLRKVLKRLPESIYRQDPHLTEIPDQGLALLTEAKSMDPALQGFLSAQLQQIKQNDAFNHLRS